jgi:peptidoglycan/LPS O-acetylase OafA/YrhL
MQSGQRIPALDGIRGLAIALVMFHHFTLYGGMRPDFVLDKVYRHVALVGWVGVDLFFVLSGFLITGILHDSRSDRHYFRNFYMRRTLRIFPLYYGVLAATFLVLPLVLDVSGSCRELLRDQAWYWTYLINVQIGLDYWPSCFVLGHFWSLAVEEQFYLVWPLLLYLLGRRGMLALCVTCILGA